MATIYVEILRRVTKPILIRKKLVLLKIFTERKARLFRFWPNFAVCKMKFQCHPWNDSSQRYKSAVPSLHLQDWQTVDREAFTIRANNQRSFKLKEAIKVGNYNILMQNQPLYNSEAHTFESSHNLFRSAFSEGFPWELLEVFSGNNRSPSLGVQFLY